MRKRKRKRLRLRSELKRKLSLPRLLRVRKKERLAMKMTTYPFDDGVYYWSGLR